MYAMPNRRRFVAFSASQMAFPWGLATLWAQTGYPTRPVRFVVPFAAGGGPDVMVRKIGPQLSEILGQAVVMENIVGAGGIIAAQNVARAIPDGYTLMLGASTHVV